MITWLFFDIGSTLVNEEAACQHRIMDMIQGRNLQLEEVEAKRMEFAREGFDGNAKMISFFGLKKTPWHTEDETLYEDTKPVLQRLKKRDYKLGILANQVAGTEERLERWGIRDAFSLIASSDKLGVAKPDRKIFEKALRMASCQPWEAVMIGDRLDNVIPAKEFGMHTIWIRRGLASCQPKELSCGFADGMIDNLGELEAILNSLERFY